MIVTVLATLCHLTVPPAGDQPIELCHEEMVVQLEGLHDCYNFPPALAQWKAHVQGGRFAGDEWRISKVRCAPGSVPVRGEL